MATEQNSKQREFERRQAIDGLIHLGRNVYDDGMLRVEHDNYYVSCSGQRILLSLKDFLLLSRLARSAERVVTLDDLWRHAWSKNEPLNGKTLRVHIYHIRQKLAPFGVKIENMTSVGYRLSVNTQANASDTSREHT